ncbi:unnamed protein product [Boreogadus saida]
MMDDNRQLAQRIDGAIQSASAEVSCLRSELSATSRRLADLGATETSSSSPSSSSSNSAAAAAGPTAGAAGDSLVLHQQQLNHHHHHHHHQQQQQQHHHDPSLHVRQKTPSTDLCYKSDISSLMVFTSPDSSLDRVQKIPFIANRPVKYTEQEVQVNPTLTLSFSHTLDSPSLISSSSSSSSGGDMKPDTEEGKPGRAWSQVSQLG